VLWGYANLAAHLPADQPVYGIKSRGQARREEFERWKHGRILFKDIPRSATSWSV